MNVQIEGSTVEELLARVADEFGPAARIIAADRVRRGGVGGFFAKERYEMTVAVPQGDDASVPSGDDLLTRALRDHDRDVQDSVARAVADALAAEEPAPQSRWEALAAEPAMAGGAGRFAPRAFSGDAYGDSAFGAAIAAALRDDEQVEVLAEQATAPTPLSLLDLADAVSAAERPAAPAPAPAAAFRPTAPPTVSTEDPGFAAVLTRLSASLAGAPGSTVPDSPASLFATPAEADAEPVIDPARPAALAPAPVVPVAPLPAATPLEPPAVVAPALVDALAELGLPAALMPADGADLLAGLARSLQALPVAGDLPVLAGEVIAVVGEGTAALAVAREIAARLRLDESAVQLAAPNDLGTRMPAQRLVTDRQSASKRRLTWATRSHPVVVAVDAPLAPSAAPATAQLLRALLPSAVVAVAPATAKSRVLGSWLDRLPFTGAPLSLAVTDTEAAPDPAAVLELGLPVESIDGRPAGPLAWAGLLAGRLAQQDR